MWHHIMKSIESQRLWFYNIYIDKIKLLNIMKATQFWGKNIDELIANFNVNHKTKHFPDFITNQMGQLYTPNLHNCLYHRPQIGLSHSQNIQFIYHNSKNALNVVSYWGALKKKYLTFLFLTPWESWIELHANFRMTR